MEASGEVVELFSGIQGEGPRVGERHLFLRLAGCNLDCAYCDQPEARTAPRRAQIERAAGSRRFAAPANPLPARTAARFIRALNTPPIHAALAVTGGEPLTQSGFLRALLPLARAAGLRVLLETNGVLHVPLRALLPHIDIVSMDLKLRSTTGRATPWRAHRLFLRAALRAGKETCVKAVVSDRTTPREVAAAARMIAECGGSAPLVLQPVTPPPRAGGPRRLRAPGPAQLLALQAAALRAGADARVIPQTHKMLRQR
jgi:organic radical activating enzyme